MALFSGKNGGYESTESHQKNEAVDEGHIKLWVREVTELPNTSIPSYRGVSRCTAASRETQPKGTGTAGHP